MPLRNIDGVDQSVTICARWLDPGLQHSRKGVHALTFGWVRALSLTLIHDFAGSLVTTFPQKPKLFSETITNNHIID